MCSFTKRALAFLVVGWYAGLVCCGMSRECQEWCDHVCPVRPGDPAGDWHQQPSSQAETASGYSGDGQLNKYQPVCTKNVAHRKHSVMTSRLFCSYLPVVGLLV